MEPNRGKSNPSKNPGLVQVNRVPSRPPIPLPARAEEAITMGGSRAWGQSSTPRRASPAHAMVSESSQSWGQSSTPWRAALAHAMVSESSQSWGQPSGPPRPVAPAHSMVSESTQSNPNRESIVNKNWPVPNPDNVRGQVGIPEVIFVEEGVVSTLHSVFKPLRISPTRRPRYVWSPITGYTVNWQPTLGLRQAQRRAPIGTPSPLAGSTYASTSANSSIPTEGGSGAESINFVDHLAFERLQIEDMDQGSSDEGSTTNSPTAHHAMDTTNPWGSSDNSEDGE